MRSVDIPIIVTHQTERSVRKVMNRKEESILATVGYFVAYVLVLAIFIWCILHMAGCTPAKVYEFPTIHGGVR